MKGEYLASGFADVDASPNVKAYTGCLRMLDSLPYYRRCKRQSYRLLRIGPGSTVLDAGCGLGDDVFRMASLAAPGGSVIGIDASADMIVRAHARSRGKKGIHFCRADAGRLPFADGSFSRCRIDRTLQHLVDPGNAVRELARVLEPGGLLLAYDNDWGSFILAADDRETTRAVLRTWCDSFPSGTVGRDLKNYFLDAGLEEIVVRPGVSLVEDFESADRIYDLRQSVRRMAADGVLDESAARHWLRDLDRRSRRGRFFSSLTAYTVLGRKPPAGEHGA